MQLSLLLALGISRPAFSQPKDYNMAAFNNFESVDSSGNTNTDTGEVRRGAK